MPALCIVVVLFASIAALCWCQEFRTIVVRVAKDGTPAPVSFTSVTYPDETVKENVRKFCSSIEATGEVCEKAVYDRFMEKQDQTQSMWSNRSQVAMRFLTDIVTQECDGEHAFASREKCELQISYAARSVKTLHAFQLSYKAEDLAEHDKVVTLPSGWRESIEDNTFAFPGKVKALQDLADDSRVVRICEVGFNFGHSVSPHNRHLYSTALLLKSAD
jgi:hypothetical protein